MDKFISEEIDIVYSEFEVIVKAGNRSRNQVMIQSASQKITMQRQVKF